MKIGRFKPETDPDTHDPRGITLRAVVGMHSIGWGISASKRCAALYMGHISVEVMPYDKQVIEARLGEYVRTLKAIARRNR